MRRVCCCTFLLCLGLFGALSQKVSAFTEGEIQSAVDSLQGSVNADWTQSQEFTCGGLLRTTDPRVLSYYARRPALDCTLTERCSRYDEATGACTGTRCLLIPASGGLPDRTLLQSCDADGVCAPPPGPHRACDFPHAQSTARRYECRLLPFLGAPEPVGFAEATCYSYFPDFRYARSYYPFAYNCEVVYDTTPVRPLEEPKGQLSLIPPYTVRSPERVREGVWEPTPGSNLATPSSPYGILPKDSSLTALDLEDAVTAGTDRTIHPQTELETRLAEYPDLSHFIEDLLQPPEVRLILPKGGLSGEQILPQEENPTPVTITLGSNPSALQRVADYLRSVPLLEVRYIPVEVLAPFASSLELTQRAAEWEAWLRETEVLARSASISISPAVRRTIDENIAALRSYASLEESIRAYRTHFPAYISALLSYVEESNNFFRTEWVEKNAERLEEWHTAYRTYLPAMRDALQGLYAEAAEYTAACLVPACRLDTVPVLEGTKPWELIPPDAELLLSNVYLPEGPSGWEENMGTQVQWHPFLRIGSPLPDLTFDFSAIFAQKTIDVPVLLVEFQPLNLPVPPYIDPQNVAADIGSLQKSVKPLPRLNPPSFDLTFPSLRLPDPATSLLFVPEAPKALDVWSQALAWRTRRLAELQNICDESPTPTTFLTHEFQLYGSKRDPAARRAAAFVPWLPSSPSFPVAWFPWEGWSPWAFAAFQDDLGTSHLPPLLAPPPCADCGTLRTERIIREHVQLDTEWQQLQEHFLRAIDIWNAEVRYFSIVPREELESVHNNDAPLWRLLLPLSSP